MTTTTECHTGMCDGGCAGPCQQGRLTCRGRPLPMGPITRHLVRHRAHWPYMMGAIAAMLVIACAAIGLALASVTA